MTKEQYLAARGDLEKAESEIRKQIAILDGEYLLQSPYREGSLALYNKETKGASIRAVVLAVHINNAGFTYDVYCHGGVERFVKEEELSPR